MKQIIIPITVLLLLFGIALAISFSDTGTDLSNESIHEQEITENEVYEVAEEDMLNDTLVEDIASSELSQAEIDGIIMMREEEKLARDVYQKLYELWGLQIFANISASEQTHTNAMEVLVDRYELDDPVKSDDIGVFTAQEFTDLYEQLVAQGSQSLEDALIVGATIEDLDIRDIAVLRDETDNEDVQLVYENLIRGSENHLRAFMKQIESRGASYEAQYISQEELEAIIQ